MRQSLATNRRATLKLLGAGALALPAIIRPRPAWAENGVLNVTTYDKFLPEGFVEKFQKETGIEVRIRLTDDQAKEYNLLSAEGENPTTDIVTVAGHRIAQFIGSDLLAPIDVARIPNWKNLNKAYQNSTEIDGKTWGMPILVGFEGLAINTDFVKEADSWEVMFDPKYKGMTAYIINDFLSITMLYLGYDGDFVSYIGKPEEAQKAVNAARDFLIAHKDMVRKFYTSGAEVQQMFINWDIYLGHSWSGPATKLIMNDQPIRLSVPKEGTYGFYYSFNIVNNAPNPENALKLMNAILATPEVGASMTRQSGFNSTITGVETLLDEREKRALTLPQDQIERINFFSPDNRKMKNEMIDRAMVEVKAG